MNRQPDIESRQPDTNKAWENLYARMQQDNLLDTADQQPSERRRPSVLRWSAIAATVLCLLALSVFYLLPGRENTSLLSLQNSDGANTLVKTLDDGSTIYLARNTSLSYPAIFASDSREVKMKGNAFFDIAKNPAKPFRIETETIIVEVLGTAFNITSDEKGKFRLSVLRGKVKVTQKENGETAFVEAGEQVSVKDELWIKTRNADNRMFARYFNKMRFKDEPLNRIVQVINRHSSRKVILGSEDIGNIKLNVSFYNDDVEALTRIISLALHLRREVKQDSIVLALP